MLSGTTFGYINGIITMLSLISGMYVTHVTKIGIIGAILATIIDGQIGMWLGFIAVVFAMINVVGGFLVTDRMLKMFKRK